MRTRWLIAGVCIVAGLVWIGQGLGILAGTGFMVGDRTWAIAGAGLVILGVAVGWTAFRAGRKA